MISEDELRIGSELMFSTVLGSLSLFLVLFPLCLFWTYTFFYKQLHFGG